MGKPRGSNRQADADAPDGTAKAKVPVEVRKQATLLFEISSLYRIAGQALRADDEVAYMRAQKLIEQYQGLFDTLAQSTSDDITREGLAAISEM